MQVIAASQQLQITSMALGHLVGFSEPEPVQQLVMGLRSIPSLASMLVCFLGWPQPGTPSRVELQNVWDSHRRVGWTCLLYTSPSPRD